MRKLLLVAVNFPPVRGGSAEVYRNLARHAGGRVVVLAPRTDYRSGREPPGWRAHDAAAGFPILRTRRLRTDLEQSSPTRSSGRLRFLADELALRASLLMRILWLLRHERIGAVCIGELMACGWLAAPLRRLARVRVAVYVHGEEITTRDGYDPGHARAARALRAADCVITVSEFSARAIHGLTGAKPAVIPNGVDTTRFFPAPRNPALAARYGLAGCFVYVSVCRLVEKKGIDVAIHAFCRLHARHPDSRLLVVGDGPDRQRLQALAAGNDAVVFAGDAADAELADHYRLGDVFVMPNRTLPDGDTEGFGLVFLEASACGLPVIAGRDGGTAEAVRDGINGLVVDGARVDDVAQAMLRLREDGALRRQLAAGGRQIAATAGWTEKAETFLAACLNP